VVLKCCHEPHDVRRLHQRWRCLRHQRPRCSCFHFQLNCHLLALGGFDPHCQCHRGSRLQQLRRRLERLQQPLPLSQHSCCCHRRSTQSPQLSRCPCRLQPMHVQVPQLRSPCLRRHLGHWRDSHGRHLPCTFPANRRQNLQGVGGSGWRQTRPHLSCGWRWLHYQF
jgi:hypothetical protein